MPKVHIDFETRSQADLRKVGASIYAEDKSTSILCVAFAVDDEPVQLIEKGMTDYASQLEAMAEDPEYIFVAHNAAFEQAIWRAIYVERYGYPEIPIERWRCTMAKSYAVAMPGNLENAAISLKLAEKKDSEGSKIMRKLCKPRRQTKTNSSHWWESEDVPEDYKKLYAYCKQDVVVERELDKMLPDLQPLEQKVWFIDQRINQQGLCLDVQAIEKAIEFSEQRYTDILETFREHTGQQVDSPKARKQLLYWSAEEGYVLHNTQKATVAAILAKPIDDVPLPVRYALECLKEASKTSLAKYPAMLERSKRGILRDSYIYHRAHPGRFGSVGVQIHNLPRPQAHTPADACLAALIKEDYEFFQLLYGDVASALSVSIRGVIVAPPETRFFIADFKQIEPRTLAWLAQHIAKLQLFIDGKDIYIDQAMKLCGYLVTKEMEERQWGKVGDIAFGYGGGINSMATFAKGYGVDLLRVAKLVLPTATLQEKEDGNYSYEHYWKRHGHKHDALTRDAGVAADILKQRWRAANPEITAFWRDIESAAIRAVTDKKPVQCGPLTWFTWDRYLVCKLPSGRFIYYPYAKVTFDARGRGKLSYWGEDSATKQWMWLDTYGGKLTENVVQAIARDLLTEAMVRLEKVYPVCMHTHDELVAAVRYGYGKLDEYMQIMTKRSKWAEGIPVEVDGWESERYGKAA